MRYQLDQGAISGPLEQLERQRWLFANLPIDPLHAGWLRKRAWVRTIHGTTRIEGNTLSDVEVDELLAGVGTRAFPRREALEVLGTREALTLVDEVGPRREVPVDERLIREIHRRVLSGQSPLLTPGDYRRGENRVVDDRGATVFTTPASGDIPALMNDFGRWLPAAAESGPAPVVAALAHLEFVAIHPFNDGNGRTARAIARLLLVRGDYALGGLVSLDAYLDHDRSAYFSAIQEAIGTVFVPGYDATPFVTYLLLSMVRAADHVLARVRGLGEVMVAIRRDISRGALPASMIDGLAFAWINRYLHAADYRRLTGRSPQSTTRDLASAVRAGYLVAGGERRGRIYGLGPRLLEVPATGETTPIVPGAAPSPRRRP